MNRVAIEIQVQTTSNSGCAHARIVAKPRTAVALGKGLFYRQLEHGIEAAYADAAQTMACNMMDDCALEGVQAFIDKRKAIFSGH